MAKPNRQAPRRAIRRNAELDLRDVFLSVQHQLRAHLAGNRSAIPNPNAKGVATELKWLATLQKHLPSRYDVAKGFVIDAKGAMSDEIDVIVHDRHFSALLLNQDGTRYVPAESVYAVFEVKQTLDGATLNYAANKIRSVRQLSRTTTRIPHAGGIHPPKEPLDILGGVLTLDTSWKALRPSQLAAVLEEVAVGGRIDLACVLENGSFECRWNGKHPEISVCEQKTALMFFMLRLVARLQSLGSVPAIDWGAYAAKLGDHRRS